MNRYAVTGTFHGSIVYAACEGDARRAFHRKYNGESITHIVKTATMKKVHNIIIKET